jgi:hypothetical protein
MKSFHTAMPGEVTIEHIQYFQDTTGMKIAERLMHYSLAPYRPKDNKEWFETEDVSHFITELNKVADIVNSMSNSTGGGLCCSESED